MRRGVWGVTPFETISAYRGADASAVPPPSVSICGEPATAARVVLLAHVGRRHHVAVERARVLDEPAAVVGVGVGAARRLHLLDEEVADRPLEADGGEGDVDVRLLRRVDGGDLGVRQEAARRRTARKSER